MAKFGLRDGLTKLSSSEAQGLVEQFRRDLRMTPLAKLPKDLTGKLLWFFHDVLGVSLRDCWRLIRPDSTSTGHNAETQASRYLQHYKRKNPAGIPEALMASGITIQDITDMARDMLYATKWRWNPVKEEFVPTEEPDWQARNRAMGRFLEIAKLDNKVRDELAVGKAEMRKMNLNTGMKFDTIQEWEEHMKGRHAEVLASRALAAKEMKLIAAGRQIIQEEGQEAADKMKQAALDAGLTGDEHIPGIDEPDDDEVKPPPAGR